ncbi:hypothetical protein AB0J83_46155 [Actinoplanes sp. NPDC049596]|uniref:hypothetical protein n=1 Tax=unclassified Actinoplanes TaxID=2626549 RepID=UPI00341BAEB7
MRLGRVLAAVAVTALAVRVVRSRHVRFMHPDGRTFEGELEVWGDATGAALLDRPGRHPVTVRISKGAGTKPHWPDVMGIGVRVTGDEPIDLLVSSCGRGRLGRHVPVPRRSFDTVYGSIAAYRTGSGRKIYLGARARLGATLEALATGPGLITFDVDGRPVARVTLGRPLPSAVDAALAFDPVRNIAPDLHPIGLLHRSRAVAYPLSQKWRGAKV